ncbi:unnamed protein product [Candidula unifasciata]|uniref:Zinc transporter ZIP10 n=1 Tax=Candidula unifasciata TaxID=100452 RepID=A0A8S3YYC2_9EUPU|nr:unnamed protein product [Candidula unifasciata]
MHVGEVSKCRKMFVYHSQEENGSVSLTFNVTIDAVTYEESNFFIKKIFTNYGNDQGLTPTELENLVHKLGLGKSSGKFLTKLSSISLYIGDCHTCSVLNDFSPLAVIIFSSPLAVIFSPPLAVIVFSSLPAVIVLSSPLAVIFSSPLACLTVNELLEAFHLAKYVSLTPQQFSFLCPALVYQLDLDVCRSHRGDINHLPNSSGDSQPVWGYSTAAVIVISLVGLLGVAVIPIMQKVFYNHLLQFLVALAVGALSGDALLHLLPHSIMSSSEHKHEPGALAEEEHNHTAAAWKGLFALAGILFFFVTERLLTIITVIKRNRNTKKQTKSKRCENFCDIESNKKSVGARLSHKENGEDECDRTVMLVHPNKALKSYADAAHEEFMHQCSEDFNSVKSEDAKNPGAAGDAEVELMETSLVDSTIGFSHSHGSHGHAHAVPNSVAAVAWMVILGDGIHNFSDGLAIGAAFANSITGGFSTSVAVFCHELPHEIGDFAVLLRAGMPAKQAVLYNCLSSLLCFVGMLIGVAVGNISSASLWIFAAVGGMFLYIALVDMLPEMSSVDPKKGENPFLHLLLQVLGILLGSGIMLVIALFEHDIKQALG